MTEMHEKTRFSNCAIPPCPRTVGNGGWGNIARFEKLDLQMMPGWLAGSEIGLYQHGSQLFKGRIFDNSRGQIGCWGRVLTIAEDDPGRLILGLWNHEADRNSFLNTILTYNRCTYVHRQYGLIYVCNTYCMYVYIYILYVCILWYWVLQQHPLWAALIANHWNQWWLDAPSWYQRWLQKGPTTLIPIGFWRRDCERLIGFLRCECFVDCNRYNPIKCR